MITAPFTNNIDFCSPEVAIFHKVVAENVNKKVLTHQLNHFSKSSEDGQGTDYLNMTQWFPSTD